jgi:hypothetical protein
VNEARKLVAQRQVLGDEICAISENGGNNAEYERELDRHRADHSLSLNDHEKLAITLPYPIMTRDKSGVHPETGTAEQTPAAVSIGGGEFPFSVMGLAECARQRFYPKSRLDKPD